MSFRFDIDGQAGIIRETWTDQIDMAQLKESCYQEWSHPDYRKHLNLLSDFRLAQAMLTASDVWTFVRWLGEHESVGKHALVLMRDVGFGLARMFSSMSEAQKYYSDSLAVFYSYEAAEAWLREPQPKQESTGVAV